MDKEKAAKMVGQSLVEDKKHWQEKSTQNFNTQSSVCLLMGLLVLMRLYIKFGNSPREIIFGQKYRS